MTSAPWGTDADAEHHELALAENRHHVCHWHVADINTVDRMDHIANRDLARERRRTPFGDTFDPLAHARRPKSDSESAWLDACLFIHRD